VFLNGNGQTSLLLKPSDIDLGEFGIQRARIEFELSPSI